MPPERLRLEDYLSTDGQSSDSIYPVEAAVIEDYEFDRQKFKVGQGNVGALFGAEHALGDIPELRCFNRCAIDLDTFADIP